VVLVTFVLVVALVFLGLDLYMRGIATPTQGAIGSTLGIGGVLFASSRYVWHILPEDVLNWLQEKKESLSGEVQRREKELGDFQRKEEKQKESIALIKGDMGTYGRDIKACERDIKACERDIGVVEAAQSGGDLQRQGDSETQVLVEFDDEVQCSLGQLEALRSRLKTLRGIESEKGEELSRLQWGLGSSRTQETQASFDEVQRFYEQVEVLCEVGRERNDFMAFPFLWGLTVLSVRLWWSGSRNVD